MLEWLKDRFYDLSLHEVCSKENVTLDELKLMSNNNTLLKSIDVIDMTPLLKYPQYYTIWNKMGNTISVSEHIICCSSIQTLPCYCIFPLMTAAVTKTRSSEIVYKLAISDATKKG